MKRIYRPELNRLMDDWRAGNLGRRSSYLRTSPLRIFGYSETPINLGDPLQVTGLFYSSESEFLEDYFNGQIIFSVIPYGPFDMSIYEIAQNVRFDNYLFFYLVMSGYCYFPHAFAADYFSSGEPGRISCDFLVSHFTPSGSGDYLYFDGTGFIQTEEESPFRLLASIGSYSILQPHYYHHDIKYKAE